MLDDIVITASADLDQNNALAIRSPLESLFRRYGQERLEITAVTDFLANNNKGVISYFFDAARINNRWAATLKAEELFDAGAAIKALDAHYWQQAISLTDVLDLMPAAKRNEWNDAIRSHGTPAFEREAVLSTLQDLISQREQLFCERVDGLFRNLSGTHLTNAPEGFSKRMILNGIHNSSYADHRRVEYIHDLRVVLACFMGRDLPNSNITFQLTNKIIKSGSYGEWHAFDGGAFRLKLFKKGTAHIEIHPSMAWRFNGVLAKLYPSAIPTRFRKCPPATKSFPLYEDLISHQAIEILHQCYRQGAKLMLPTALFSATGGARNANIRKEVVDILERIGGVSTQQLCWEFDYDVRPVLEHIIAVGTLPDESFQYYPTQPELAQHVIDLAQITDKDTVLEPSAGQGGLADFVPKVPLLCVEISPLNCTVLKTKGYETIQGDFLTLESKCFSKIVMNPPFSGNRAALHVRCAAERWLASGGRLVAILPASLKGKELMPGMRHTYSKVLSDQFKHTGVSVTILTLDKPE